MSAYIVSSDLIRYLVSAGQALAGRGSGALVVSDKHAQQVGQMLWDENVRSVRHRYPTAAADDLPCTIVDSPEFRYVHAPWRGTFDPVQVFKACDCLEYQSCEHAEWAASEALEFLQALRGRYWRELPGYEEAEWGAPPEPTVKQAAKAVRTASIVPHPRAAVQVPGLVSPPIHTPTTRPTLEQAQAMVGGLVELLELDNGEQVLVNEEGRLFGLEVNVTASKRWPQWGPLVGPVVHLQGAARWVD